MSAPLDLDRFRDSTPGPWSVAPCEISGKVWIERRSDYLKSGIARMGFAPAEGHGGTLDGNAALIAAAPDLLAECRRLRSALANMADVAREHASARGDAVTEAAQLRSALERAFDHMEHRPACSVWRRENPVCDCAIAIVRDALAGRCA